MSMYPHYSQPEMFKEIQRQHEEQRKIAEAFNRGKAAGIEEERAKAASQKLLAPPATATPTQELLRTISNTLLRIEQGLTDMKLKGTKIDTHRLDKKGKLVPLDKAPAQVKQARRRKKNTVTGVKRRTP